MTLKNSGNSQFLSTDLRKQGRKIADMWNCIPPSDPLYILQYSHYLREGSLTNGL